MFDLQSVVQRARTSPFHRRVLNWSLDRMIPFNKPHGLRVVEIGEHYLKTRVPFSRRNLNHIRGLHACALATVSEFTTGFLLVTKLDASRYRLIMKQLEMHYHYQGKMDAIAEFHANEAWLTTNIFQPLQSQDSVVVKCDVKIHDVQGNHLTTGFVHWQIKNWDKVKTKA